MSHAILLPSDLINSHNWNDFCPIGKSSITGLVYLAASSAECTVRSSTSQVCIWAGHPLIANSWQEVSKFSPGDPCLIKSAVFNSDCTQIGLLIAWHGIAIAYTTTFLQYDLVEEKWSERDLIESFTFGHSLELLSLQDQWLLMTKPRFDYSSLGIVARNSFYCVNLKTDEPSLEYLGKTPSEVSADWVVVAQNSIFCVAPRAVFVSRGLGFDWRQMRSLRPLPAPTAIFADNNRVFTMNSDSVVSELEMEHDFYDLRNVGKINVPDCKCFFTEKSLTAVTKYGNCVLLLNEYFGMVPSLKHWATAAVQKMYGNGRKINDFWAWDKGITNEQFREDFGYKKMEVFA